MCTGNQHKLEELSELLVGFSLEALPRTFVLPPEVGDTFEDNARIKAEAGHGTFGDRWVIADDSGIVVDALDGAPGVRSARFAGEAATDDDNVRLLLQRLEGVDGADARSARFECTLVAIAPDGNEFVATGTVEGSIAHEARGTTGFGYDPVFVPAGHSATFAQLGSRSKAAMSHRARAARALQELLRAPA